MILEIEEERHIVGGKFVDPTESCGGDKELVDGEIASSRVSPVEIRSYPLSKIDIDDKLGGGLASANIEIGSIRYWKHRNDPKDF